MTDHLKSKTKEELFVRTKLRSSLDCPNCGSPIHESEININKSLAQCSSCNHITKINKDDFFHGRAHRPEVIMPEGTDLLTLSDSLDIRINWKKSITGSGIKFLTLFTLMWNAIVGVFVVSAFMSGAFESLIGVSIHAAVGVGLLYWLTGLFVNKTDIIVKKNRIEISHSPLKMPLKPNKVIEGKDFKQFYVTKYVSSTTNGQPNYAYGLYAINHDGSKVEILKGMDKETQLYLEQEIERYLRIEDERVPGAIV